MRRFWLKLLLFMSPFLLMAGLLVAFAVYVGEFAFLSQIASLQNQYDHLVLYDSRFQEDVPYRRAMLQARQPEILLLGSSRTLTFRSGFFNKNSDVFYNASLRTLDVALSAEVAPLFLADSSPKILLLALDQPAFRADYARFWPPVNLQGEFLSAFDRVASLVQDSWKNRDEISLSMVLARHEPVYGGFAQGYTAISVGRGYRNDGSLQLGYPEVNVNRDALSNFFDVPRVHIYETGTETNPQAFEQVEAILALAESKGIQVVGFFPPFAPTSYAEQLANPQHSYIPQAASRLNDLFQAYDAQFFDFSNGTDLGIGDEMMIDDWHLSERASLLLYLRLLEALPASFEAYSDADYLQSRLESSEHPLIIFGAEL